MTQYAHLHSYNKCQMRFYIRSELLDELGWYENTNLVSEMGTDEITIRKDPNIFQSRLTYATHYNAISLPDMAVEGKDKRIRLTTKNGVLILKLFM